MSLNGQPSLCELIFQNRLVDRLKQPGPKLLMYRERCINNLAGYDVFSELIGHFLCCTTRMVRHATQELEVRAVGIKSVSEDRFPVSF